MSDIRASDPGCLDPKEVRVTREAFGQIRVTVGGRSYENVRPVRAFPLSAPTRYIGLLDADGVQFGMVADLRALEPSSRRVLEDELAMLYFCAQVKAVVDAQWKHHYTSWVFLTDRGERQAIVKERSDIRSISDTHVIFTDVFGIRYEIRDIRKLDDRSREFLEEEL